MYLILHNIRSAYNVGAIFRTADAAGISKIFLTGRTPAPNDRFGRARKDIAKTALGAEKTMPWESARFQALVRRLAHERVRIVAVEQDRRAKDYKKVRVGKTTALVFGSEVSGLPKSVLNAADEIAEIPMRGAKESLNVSVAAGVVLFRLLDV